MRAAALAWLVVLLQATSALRPGPIARWRLRPHRASGSASTTGTSTNNTSSSLGDITGGLETTVPFLPSFTPLERIVITATGNLQRIVSSYYNCPVTVECVHNRETAHKQYERQVELAVNLSPEAGGEQGRFVFCVAKSTIEVLSDELDAAIKSGTVGVGQLFRHYNILPDFRLLDAGRNQDGFWRLYELNSALVRCRIHETFRLDTFELHKPTSMRTSKIGSGGVDVEERP